jgi:hypothetical protein
MAVLWFAREGIDSTSGFAAYELPIQDIATKLGRAGFYKTAFSPVEIVTKLGKPNAT